MKNSNPLVKALTISFFAILIGGFVAFRAGAFESFMNEERSAGNYSGEMSFVDSPVKDTTEKEVMMSGSKAMVILDHEKEKTPQDTTKKKTSGDTGARNSNNPNQTQTPPKNINMPVYMGGSKSGPVFTPKPDTQQQQQQQKPK